MTNTDTPIPQLDFLVPRSQRVQEFLQAADQRLANLKHAKAGLEELAERREQEIYLELIDSGQAPAKNAESRKAQLSKALWEDKPYRDIRAQLDQQLVAVSNEEVKLRALEREWRWLLVMLEVKMAQERGRVVQVEARTDSRPPVTRYVPWADPLSPPPNIPQVDTEIPESQKGRPHDTC